MKILVAYRAIHNTAGGVERMSSLIMNDLIARGHEIDFVTLDKEDAVSFYKLDPKISWHKLGLGDAARSASWGMRLKRIFAIRRLIKQGQPDVILAFQEASFLSARLAAIGLNVPVIAAERNSPSRFHYMPLLKKFLALNSFRFARYVTVQCENFKRYYPAQVRTKIVTIPNPIFPVMRSDIERKNVILAIGRLEYQKNFAVLVKAFSKIAAQFPDWTMVIVGDGADRTKLLTQIKSLNLSKNIFLHSATQDMTTYYQSASLFCLPSRWEGFPNALAEALANGLPGIGFAECDGVNELIQSGKNGILASGNGDPGSLADALQSLMADKKLRDEMAENAIQSITPYAPSLILGNWERLLKQAAGE